MNADDRSWPLGAVTVLGAHILDVLGRPVEEIPPGQGSVRLREIRATAAGTAAGTGVDLAKLGARVLAVGALGDDLLGDIVVAAMARHGVDTSGLSRKSGVQTSATILPIRANGERPALHVPGATPLLELADVDLDRVRQSRALLIGAPDALGPIVDDGLAQVIAAAGQAGRSSPSTCCTPAARGTSSGSPRCWRGGLVRAERRPAARPHRPRRPRPGASRTCWRSAPPAWP